MPELIHPPILTYEQTVALGDIVTNRLAAATLDLAGGQYAPPPTSAADQAQRHLLQAAILTERLLHEHAAVVQRDAQVRGLIELELVTLVQAVEQLPEAQRAAARLSLSVIHCLNASLTKVATLPADPAAPHPAFPPLYHLISEWENEAPKLETFTSLESLHQCLREIMQNYTTDTNAGDPFTTALDAGRIGDAWHILTGRGLARSRYSQYRRQLFIAQFPYN